MDGERMATTVGQNGVAAEAESSGSHETAKPQQEISPEQFVTEWPLYSLASITNFQPPDWISFHCTGDCGKETTWQRVQRSDLKEVAGEIESNLIQSAGYICLRCQKSSLVVFYGRMKYVNITSESTGVPTSLQPPLATRRVPTKVMKVGQYPELSIKVPKALEKNLGKDATALYRKGITSRNCGYGLVPRSRRVHPAHR
jgi:hypothetical protein